jgi:hypothetical protein
MSDNTTKEVFTNTFRRSEDKNMGKKSNLKISFEEFKKLWEPIEKYQKDYETHSKALKLMYGSSHVVPELGSSLLDSYIDLLEKYLDDKSKIISWYIWERYLDNQNYHIEIDGKEVCVNSLEDLYNII